MRKKIKMVEGNGEGEVIENGKLCYKFINCENWKGDMQINYPNENE